MPCDAESDLSRSDRRPDGVRAAGGGGYPDNLRGEDIPEEARIIAVADAYDAMSSRRSYRDVLPQEVVREEIRKGRGTQFDPKFADIILKMIDEDTEYDLREK